MEENKNCTISNSNRSYRKWYDLKPYTYTICLSTRNKYQRTFQMNMETFADDLIFICTLQRHFTHPIVWKSSWLITNAWVLAIVWPIIIYMLLLLLWLFMVCGLWWLTVIVVYHSRFHRSTHLFLIFRLILYSIIGYYSIHGINIYMFSNRCLLSCHTIFCWLFFIVINILRGLSCSLSFTSFFLSNLYDTPIWLWSMALLNKFLYVYVSANVIDHCIMRS